MISFRNACHLALAGFLSPLGFQAHAQSATAAKAAAEAPADTSWALLNFVKDDGANPIPGPSPAGRISG